MSTPSSRASSADSARFALRAGTADAHADLDQRFGRFDLADRDDYAKLLAAHAAAVLPLEAALDRAGMADLLADWPARRRGAALLADLRALGAEPAAALPPPAVGSPAEAWGMAYVLEGSRLGGALLARQAGPGLPTAYFAAPQPPGAWRMFVESLDEALYSKAMRDDATRAAMAAFALFGTAAAQAGA